MKSLLLLAQRVNVLAILIRDMCLQLLIAMRHCMRYPFMRPTISQSHWIEFASFTTAAIILLSTRDAISSEYFVCDVRFRSKEVGPYQLNFP